MYEPLSYTTAFILGLLSGVHCIGMCGGIISALSFSIPPELRTSRHLTPILIGYNIGRIFSYTVAGAMVGSLAWLLRDSIGQAIVMLRLLAGLMLIAMGLYLAGWWKGLTHLESLGSHLWRHVQPIGKQMIPVTRLWQALVLGALWGWLPCGLTYSVLTWSAASANWQQAALMMLSFGCGTLPVMLVTGRFAHGLTKFLQTGNTRRTAAILVIIFGVWTCVAAVQHNMQDQQHQHGRAHHEAAAKFT